MAQLDKAEVRGQVLHFFANHELLALELMALALLRFPDAPEGFRKRLVATMRDEQRHLNLYIKRMSDFGLEFGEFGLNGYFWSALADMKTPLDFVSAMSLTFEQANLDFSLYFMKAFEKVGDVETAAIMAEVLKDEVAHVRHGVRYFEAWRDADVSQWDAYQAALTYPLTPARAKGPVFAEQERLKAGLSPDFISALKVYSHSKGRPPRVLVFNPETDLHHAPSPPQTPTRIALELQHDLEGLMALLARHDDVVIVNRKPRQRFLTDLKDAGYILPEYVEYAEPSGESNVMQGRSFETLVPWGWDRTLHRQYASLLKRCRQPRFEGVADVEAFEDLNSKARLVKFWDQWQACLNENQRAMTASDPPALAYSIPELERQLCEGQGRARRFMVIKAPFGAAGRQAIRCERDGLNAKQRTWCERMLRRQKSLVIEPWHQRLVDLSYLFEVRPDGRLKEVGLTRFLTDNRGNYRGTVIGPAGAELEPEVSRFFHRAGGQSWVLKACRAVAKRFSQDAHARGYLGPVGIDLMVIRDYRGDLKLRLPLEFNVRYTMGHVAIAAGNPLGSQHRGLFWLFSRADLRASGTQSFAELSSRLCEDAAVRCVPLADARVAKHVWPCLLSAKRVTHVLGTLAEMGLTIGSPSELT